MGQVHFAAWSSLEERGVQVAGVADTDLSRTAWIEKHPGVRAFDDIRAAIEAPGVDIVDICLPTPFHREAIALAAASGRAILCEKPLALTPEEAEAAASEATGRGLPFMVAHVVRFFPDYRRARELAVGGSIGQVRSARCFRGGAMPAWNSWMRDHSQSGGVILDGMIHDFDYLRWVFGPVAKVYAVSTAVGDQGGQHAVVILRFQNDAIAMAEGAWSYPPGSPFQTEAEISGTAGLIQWSSEGSKSFRMYSGEKGRGIESRFPSSPLDPDPYRLEIEHFLDHVTRGVALEITAEDAVAAVKVAAAAIRSAREGKSVEVRA